MDRPMRYRISAAIIFVMACYGLFLSARIWRILPFGDQWDAVERYRLWTAGGLGLWTALIGQHNEHRHQHSPEDAHNRLTVSDGNVSSCNHVEELAMSVQLDKLRCHVNAFVLFVAEVAFYGVVAGSFCKLDLHWFFVELEALDCFLGLLRGCLVFKDDKGLASHAEVLVRYDIDDGAELGKGCLKVLFVNGQFDRLIEILDIQCLAWGWI